MSPATLLWRSGAMTAAPRSGSWPPSPRSGSGSRCSCWRCPRRPSRRRPEQRQQPPASLSWWLAQSLPAQLWRCRRQQQSSSRRACLRRRRSSSLAVSCAGRPLHPGGRQKVGSLCQLLAVPQLPARCPPAARRQAATRSARRRCAAGAACLPACHPLQVAPACSMSRLTWQPRWCSAPRQPRTPSAAVLKC